jgi:serine/threonine-protein kinase
VDARQRFLHPESQPAPRRINPGISIRTEKAILWAMELHPDQRPESIESFRQYLFGTKELPTRPLVRPTRVRTLDALLAPPESILFGVSAILLLLSLIATFGR